MKATFIAFLPVAYLASCTNNSTSAQQPVPPVAQSQANPYGVPGQSDVGQYTPDAAPYQPVQPINPPALPAGSSTPPPVNSNYPQPGYNQQRPVVPGVSPPSIGGRSHSVVKGDSLWGLSRKYGVSADAIRQANGIGAGDSTIRTGQTLQIPTR